MALHDLLPNMAAGLCLMLALGCLARDAGSAMVVLFLIAAGLAHAGDLLMRWRRSARSTAVQTPASTPARRVRA